MNIRTKIIGGYVLFVVLILSFLGLNHKLTTSNVAAARKVYNASEGIRLEMESENVFWRQVIALTDYFLAGEDEHYVEFHDYRKLFEKRVDSIESSLSGPAEKEVMLHLRTQYGFFVSRFDKAAALYKSGRKEEALQVEVDEVDAAEGQVEEALAKLSELKRGEISEAIEQIKSFKRYSGVLPALSTTIENTEAIYEENEGLQQSLRAESNFLKQVIALTDLFVLNESEHIEEFAEYGKLFEQDLQNEKSFAKRDDERELLEQIAVKHRAFTGAFGESAKVYEGGEKARALRIEIEKVDPSEDELEQALKQYYPLKEQSMKNSLENVVLVTGTALSITRSLGIYVLFTMIIGLVFGAISAVRITSPIRRLAEATRGIAAGDFSVRLAPKGGDEVSDLARSFDAMAETLQGTTVSKHYVDGIIESMNDSLVVASQEGRIVTVNQATCRLLGYSQAELIGQPLEMLVAANDQSGNVPGDDPNDGAPIDDVEKLYLTKDGRTVPVLFSRAALRLDSGQTLGKVCVAKDITERKRAERALRESEHKLSSHIQQTPLAVIEWNLNAEIVEWNPAAQTIFGYAREDVIGRRMAQLLVSESATDAGQEWHDLVSQKGGQHTTRENITKDGRTIVCEWYNTPLESEGRVFGIASMVQDSTERAQMHASMEEARDLAVESARLKSEFLANMSHEIRTPMNGVIGMTELLLDTELSDDQREFAETIRSSGDGLLTIINDILDFSKIEAGKLQFEILDFDLRDAVEGAVELLAERARHKKIELASLIQDDVTTRLRGDPGRLRQVVTNLIGNALKFTEHGEVVVRVESETETDDTAIVRITVTDTGIGISDAAQRNLFQAFTQADGTTTRKYGGTGLGLAISKQLVELMDGQIGVTSSEGGGSTFWFTAKFDKQPGDAEVAPASTPGLEKVRVLVVDDNATNRKILAHQLSSWGTIHQDVDSGFAALDLLRAAARGGLPFDLAVLDLMMPGMDGFELAREIKADPSIASVRLVLLTSYGDRGHAATAHQAGVAAYLTKPVRQSLLFSCLTSVMGQPTPELTVDDGALPPPAKSPARPALKAREVITDKLILVAEDNIVNQKIAVRQLLKLGYRADVVTNGRRAVEALARVHYDLVLMDCQMPIMDGYEATGEIRRNEAEAKHTPIVAMTAHAMESDRAKCIAAGMDDYISKPIKTEALEDILKRFLGDDRTSSKGGAATPRDASPPVIIGEVELALQNAE